MSRRQVTRWIVAAGPAALLAGCSGVGGTKQATLLRTEDFIADPATMPTALPPSSPVSTAAALSDRHPSQHVAPVVERPVAVADIVVVPGPPPTTPSHELPRPSDAPSLVDAKVGEINGRPIRVQEMFDAVGDRVAAIAKDRTLSPQEWMMIGRRPPEGSVSVQRPDWLRISTLLFQSQLNHILQDELLSAEARATLRPEQKQGLRHFVEERTQDKRRGLGGSQAELERQLRADKMNEQVFGRNIETQVLISIQLEDKVRNRYKASWKDVQRYYRNNIDVYQPPATARFRMIVVPADNAQAIEQVQQALDRTEPFAEVASRSVNQYNAAEGGLFADGRTLIKGPYDKSEPFSFDELNQAARPLHPGQHTARPVERTDRNGHATLTWLHLESLTSQARSLSDPDVQLAIADRLNLDAQDAGRAAYIRRLVQRATFSDIDAMTRSLVDIAAERYWPAEK